jgi:hypothetical protein
MISTNVCGVCHRTSPSISSAIGVCGECLLKHFHNSRSHLRAVHADSRDEFNLPAQPPRAPNGIRCNICSNECAIGENEYGYCGLRTVKFSKLVHLAGMPARGFLHWYRDPLPTNCVADWVCGGEQHRGCHNLAVFYAGCTMELSLLPILAFLALIFLPSIILIRFHWNFLTRFFYQVACLWLGLFLYLLMALILLWAFYGAARLFGRLPDMKTLTVIFVLAPVTVSAYGFWNARNPVLTSIEVKIEGLPEQWQHKTIVQLSDVHLGAFQGTGFFGKIVEKVNSLNPELILITGDLFDGMGGDLPAYIPLLNSL